MSKWKLVPVEPTDEMIKAIDGLICSSYLWPVYAYRAMIDAAPVPTAADCTSVCDAYAAENQQFSDELARLRAENERLKADAADAARYRWIKRGASFREERDMGPGGCWSIFVAVPRRPAVNSLDTAIDAAMAQGKV